VQATSKSNPQILRRPWFWLGIALSVLCFWLAARSVSFVELKESLNSARYAWLLPAVVTVAAAVFTRAWRWVLLLDKREHLLDSFWSQSLGFLFTNIFPLRLGEPDAFFVHSRNRAHTQARPYAGKIQK
jgi:uncharacterized membrane protein YbhN (UPF0104 family)